jgi:UDP-2-acetamido-3-amino-2,3-dideoxy-glucuronate N-acetyltransferase
MPASTVGQATGTLVQMTAEGLDPSIHVHPLGLCESTDVGPRTRVWAFAHVMEGAVVGADCNVGDHAFVETGAVVGDRVTIKNGVLVWDLVKIEDDVFLGPGATFTNDLNPRAAFKKDRAGFSHTLVRRGATIGANATVVCGTVIGEHAFVGAGSVVVNDIGPHVIAVGNPARQIGWVCECGERLPDTLACACGRAYRRAPGASGLEQISRRAAARGRSSEPS